MSPHYDRYAGASERTLLQREPGTSGDDAMDDAAEAIRRAELEAVQAGVRTDASTALERMSIDELRKLAADLDVPNRGTITERDRLVVVIRERLEGRPCCPARRAPF